MGRKHKKFVRSERNLDYRGKTYASEFEIAVRKALDKGHKSLRKTKELEFEFDYEGESFEYVLTRSYTPDWPVHRADGTTIYIESKGQFDRDARGKMLAVKAQHPDKEFVLLFQRDNPIYKGSKTTYTDWAEQHGFDYAVNCLPVRWLLGSHCPEKRTDEVIPLG